MDNQLKKIASLKWLPWIGDDYLRDNLAGNRLLIVAESHYDWGEEGARDELEDQRFTRWFIENKAIKDPGAPMRVLRNLEKALFQEKLAPTEVIRFWHTVGYYNFIQRIFENQAQRPFGDDYPNGWKNFFSLVRILKPDYCLFAGVGASDWIYCFNEEARANKFIVSPIECLPKIGSCSPRLSSICSSEGHTTKLIFIRHPSRYFSARFWGGFVEQQMPKYITWLRERVRHTYQ